jgi:imidazolonepropionase-like amidohydrolase
MTSRPGIAAAIAIAAAAVPFVNAQQPSATIAIRAARLFDGKSDAAIAEGVVVVQGSRITALGSRLPVPAGAQVAVR